MITVFLSPLVSSPHESQLVEGVLGHSFLDTLPARSIGDKAYDSDPLDPDLAERYGIEMIAPHRGERREPTQDGRPLRRYRRRWRLERLFAWRSQAHTIRGGGAKPYNSQLAEDPLIAIAFGAARLHLMASFEEMPYPLRDILVDFSIRRGAGAMGKVSRPTS